MPKRTFGTRREPPGKQGEASAAQYTKADFVRGVIAANIHQYRSASPAERDGLAMRIRILQDQIAAHKRLTARPLPPTDLDWVDTWRPED